MSIIRDTTILLLLMILLLGCAETHSMSLPDVKQVLLEFAPQNGHSQKVYSVEFSADSKYFLTGSWDNIVKLWDVKSGKEIRSLYGNTASVTTVAFSPNSQYATSGSIDGRINIWQLTSGTLLHSFSGHDSLVNAVKFSADNKYLISASYDKTIKLWELNSGNNLRTYTGHKDTINSIDISRDGRYIVSGSSDSLCKLWDFSSGKELKSFHGHSGAVRSVALSFNGRYCASGSSDKTIKIWEIESGECVKTISGHEGIIFSIAFSSDDNYIISGSDDKSVRLWEINTAKQTRILKEHSDTVCFVDISINSKYVLSASYDSTVILWDLINSRIIKKYSSTFNYINSVRYLKNRKCMVSASDNGSISEWDINYGRERWKFNYNSPISAMVVSPDEIYFAFSLSDPSIHLQKLDSDKGVAELYGHSAVVNQLDFSPDGNYLLSGSNDKTIILWDLKKMTQVNVFRGHTDKVTSVSFSPNGKYFISGSSDSTIILWDIDKGTEIRTYRGHASGIKSLMFSPNSRYFISGSLDKTIKLWDIANSKAIKSLSFKGWLDWVNCVAFSPDGKFIAAALNNTIILFDSRTLVEYNRFQGPQNVFLNIDFTQENNIVAGSSDGTTLIWNIEDGSWTAFISSGIDDTEKWLVYTADGYWDGSNDCGELVAMVQGLECWNIDQFAVRNNRPDIILERIGSRNKELITFYKSLYQKRLHKLGLTETQLAMDYHVPEAKILDNKQDGKFVELFLLLSDEKENLKFYNIYVNDVPIFGSTGKPITGHTAQLTEHVELCAGTNKIEVSCMNVRGAESFRPVVYADCKIKAIPNLYYIGFGVSHYQNKLDGQSVDLSFAAKDASDLAKVYSSMQGKQFGRIFINVFQDSEVTVENIKVAKALLANSKPDDTFVLFISGHGKYVGNTYYFLTHETNFNNIAGTAAAFELIEDILQGIAPRQKLFLMDTCESGEREGEEQVTYIEGVKGLHARSLPGGKGILIEKLPVKQFLLEEKNRYIYNDLVRRSGAIVFSSSLGIERSLETDEYQNGLFTAMLKKAFNGSADSNNDGTVDIKELTGFVCVQVPLSAKLISNREGKSLTQHPTVDRDNIYIQFGFPVVK
ncbi:MAG: WD40 repeat domain-containing protein [Spirochaetales bacterium]|nr:WD40 repeat domain-containing protein [Spirochaetales bacterium]